MLEDVMATLYAQHRLEVIEISYIYSSIKELISILNEGSIVLLMMIG
jgi:hypothetical protein